MNRQEQTRINKHRQEQTRIDKNRQEKTRIDKNRQEQTRIDKNRLKQTRIDKNIQDQTKIDKSILIQKQTTDQKKRLVYVGKLTDVYVYEYKILYEQIDILVIADKLHDSPIYKHHEILKYQILNFYHVYCVLCGLFNMYCVLCTFFCVNAVYFVLCTVSYFKFFFSLFNRYCSEYILPELSVLCN